MMALSGPAALAVVVGCLLVFALLSAGTWYWMYRAEWR